MDLDRDRIERTLFTRGAPLGLPLQVVSTTVSTNEDAKAAARAGAPSGAAFVADAQTGGRGRFGRTWHSPPGENLYASFLLRPMLPARVVPLVTLAAGLAVVDAVSPMLAGHAVMLKWPNDVLVDDRKLSGVLSEAHLSEPEATWIVVGVGLNVHTTRFPEELATKATSLALALAGAPSLDRSALFIELAVALGHRMVALAQRPAQIVADVSAKDALRGRGITVDGEPATAVGIDESGALRVERADGSMVDVFSGEIALAGAVQMPVKTARPPPPK